MDVLTTVDYVAAHELTHTQASNEKLTDYDDPYLWLEITKDPNPNYSEALTKICLGWHLIQLGYIITKGGSVLTVGEESSHTPRFPPSQLAGHLA